MAADFKTRSAKKKLQNAIPILLYSIILFLASWFLINFWGGIVYFYLNIEKRRDVVDR